MWTVVSDDDLAGLDEFGLLHENAEQIGVSGPLPSVQRVESGPISAIKWGDEPPQVVFLHGGGQNAHTWDTVIVGLGRARAGRRPSRARPIGLARGRRLRSAPGRRDTAPGAARVGPEPPAGRRHVAGRADRAAAGRHRTGSGAGAGTRRRHAVGARTPRADDQGADGHRRSGAGRPHVSQLRRDARRDGGRGAES